MGPCETRLMCLHAAGELLSENNTIHFWIECSQRIPLMSRTDHSNNPDEFQLPCFSLHSDDFDEANYLYQSYLIQLVL